MPTSSEELMSSDQQEYLSLVETYGRNSTILQQRQKENPLKYYWPHTLGCDGSQCLTVKQSCIDAYDYKYTIQKCPQYLFHTSLADVRAYFGANRAGKTTAGAVEILFHCTGSYPTWYPMERRYDRPVKGRILANDFKKAVGEVITDALDAWIPKGALINREKNSQGVYDKYYIKSEFGGISAFDIITYEQSSDVAEGWSGDFAWYDEPPPMSHRTATARGLIDRMGWEVFTLTPLKEAWLFDTIWVPGNKLMGGENA